MSESAELSAGQEKALSALLTCATIEGAAKAAGCSVATLRRYRLDPPFADALRRERAALLEAATTGLRVATGKAVTTLIKLLDSPSDGVKARAADLILTNAFKAAEIEDLTERLEKIEAAQQETDERRTR